jgi:hypothetical protein
VDLLAPSETQSEGQKLVIPSECDESGKIAPDFTGTGQNANCFYFCAFAGDNLSFCSGFAAPRCRD